MEVNRRLLLFLCFFSLVKCEPRCSRFEYEEKLLEKMVRLEFDVSQMLKETQKLAATVNENLTKMKKDAEDVESRLEAGLIDLKKDRLELKENVSSATGLMQRFSEQLNDTMEIYRNTTTSRLEDLSITPLVSFRAWSVVDTSPATNQIIVYPTVQQNDDNGYDNTTGIFTTPVAGLYLFSVQVVAYPGKYFYYAIIKDDNTVLIFGRAYENSGHPTTSSTSVAYLNVGEKVWVKCRSGSSSDIIYSSSSNQFLGILIHK